MDDSVEQGGEVGRLRAGDPHAWETLYRRVYPSMLAYARRRLATTEEAQDAVSEALTRTVAGIDRLDATGASSRVLAVRRAAPCGAGPSTHVLPPPRPPRPAGDRPTSTPWSRWSWARSTTPCGSAFGRLPERDRELLELRVVAGLSAEEVADRPRHASRGRPHRAVTRPGAAPRSARSRSSRWGRDRSPRRHATVLAALGEVLAPAPAVPDADAMAALHRALDDRAAGAVAFATGRARPAPVVPLASSARWGQRGGTIHRLRHPVAAAVAVAVLATAGWPPPAWRPTTFPARPGPSPTTSACPSRRRRWPPPRGHSPSWTPRWRRATPPGSGRQPPCCARSSRPSRPRTVRRSRSWRRLPSPVPTTLLATPTTVSPGNGPAAGGPSTGPGATTGGTGSAPAGTRGTGTSSAGGSPPGRFDVDRVGVRDGRHHSHHGAPVRRRIGWHHTGLGRRVRVTAPTTGRGAPRRPRVPGRARPPPSLGSRTTEAPDDGP